MSVIHVATTGSDTASGSADDPLRTIQRAAELATPGTTVVVHGGVYREWVRPPRGGRGEDRRIVFQAAEGEHVRITGSERVTGWEREDGDVWRVTLPNGLFGERNPFAIEVAGDWLIREPGEPAVHLGEVYLEGRSGYEVSSREAVADPDAVPLTTVDRWTGRPGHERDPEQVQQRWYAEVGEDATTVWAHFPGVDPNAALVEVNVRPAVFFPTEHHVDYITVRGFELCQAATPWAPPTADQPGLVGPNWAKGWVIEDNDIHDATCSAVSLGKERSTGHNLATERGDKPGYQYQLESVFAARQIGWDREHIGSHVVRRNTIHHCGQNGIVGHLGCVFSRIEDNHIHAIATKREFFGHEIGGIKLHAPIDVVISGNRIHDCTLGTWLDWQTQGTRISRNLYYGNTRDLFIEVSHGPFVVDHNVLASPVSLDNFAQGGAYVGNLVAGAIRLEPVRDRATPYHRPHSTQVAGYAVVEGGDDRWIGNLFLGGDLDAAYEPGSLGHDLSGYGTLGYADHPGSPAEYLERVEARRPGDHKPFLDLVQHVDVRGNAYVEPAAPRPGEEGAAAVADGVTVEVVDDGDQVHLELTLPGELAAPRVGLVTGADLGVARFPDAAFEDPSGAPVVLDTDLVGARKDAEGRYPAGPLAQLSEGSQRVRVW